MSTFDSHTIIMGFDKSKVVSGAKEIDKILSDLGRRASGSTLQGRDPTGRTIATLAKANALEARRLALKRRINQAETLGEIPVEEAKALHRTEKDIVALKAKELDLTNKIVDKQKQIRIANELNTRAATSKGILTPTKQASIENDLFREMQKRQRLLKDVPDHLQGIKNNYEDLLVSLKKVKSVDDLKHYRNRVTEWKRLNTEITLAQTKMTGIAKITRGFSNSLTNLATSYVSVFAAINIGRDLLRTGAELENINAMMLMGSKTSQQAAIDFSFVRDTAYEMGLELTSTARSFSKFTTAARSNGMGIKESQDLFKDLSMSIRASGVDADKANLAFLAFQQMLAGPNIQMQEMNQANEHLTTVTAAARIALQKMGYEVENYRDIISTGQVESKEFVTQTVAAMKAMAVESGSYQASLETLTVSQGRFRLRMQEMFQTMFQTGRMGRSLTIIMDSMAGFVSGLTPLVTTLSLAINGLLEGLNAVGSVMNTVLEAFGFEGGLASIIGFLAGPAGVLLVISKLKDMIGWLREWKAIEETILKLRKMSFVVRAAEMAMANPFAAVAGIAAATAVGYGAAKVIENITTNNITNNNQVQVDASNTDADEVIRRLEAGLQSTLEPQ